jgi:hypothetical protein
VCAYSILCHPGLQYIATFSKLFREVQGDSPMVSFPWSMAFNCLCASCFLEAWYFAMCQLTADLLCHTFRRTLRIVDSVKYRYSTYHWRSEQLHTMGRRSCSSSSWVTRSIIDPCLYRQTFGVLLHTRVHLIKSKAGNPRFPIY